MKLGECIIQTWKNINSIPHIHIRFVCPKAQRTTPTHLYWGGGGGGIYPCGGYTRNFPSVSFIRIQSNTTSLDVKDPSNSVTQGWCICYCGSSILIFVVSTCIYRFWRRFPWPAKGIFLLNWGHVSQLCSLFWSALHHMHIPHHYSLLPLLIK